MLARPELAPEGLLRGRVEGARGQAVAGARVGCGLASVLCDQEGEFSLALDAEVSADRIHALKEGFLPARMDRPGPPDAELDPLHGGRTGVVSVSSTARELWLYSGSERLDRRGIELRVGQVTEIRW